MFNWSIFLIFVVVCFLVVGIAISLFHKDALFTISIGAVIGANVYNIDAFPIQIGKFIFGMDGIVYCIFLFCLLIMFIDYGKTSMRVNLYTAMFSIFFTALLSFFGTIFLKGNWNNQIWSTLSFLFSVLATYVAVIIMVHLYQSLSQKINIPICFSLCMLVGSLVNSIIYFGLTFILSGSLGKNFIFALSGSAITKFVATIICTILFVIYEKYWNNSKKTKKSRKTTNNHKKIKE